MRCICIHIWIRKVCKKGNQIYRQIFYLTFACEISRLPNPLFPNGRHSVGVFFGFRQKQKLLKIFWIFSREIAWFWINELTIKVIGKIHSRPQFSPFNNNRFAQTNIHRRIHSRMRMIGICDNDPKSQKECSIIVSQIHVGLAFHSLHCIEYLNIIWKCH